MALISLVVKAWLGSMFVYSAGLKLAQYDRAGSLVRPYHILPPRIGSAVGFVLPWVELLAGMMLLLDLLFPVGPLLGVALGASFAYASLRVLRRGADVPCGCTGSTEDRVSRTTLIRALLITMSSFLFLGIDRLPHAPLPLLVVIPLVVVSLLPTGLSTYLRIRDAQQRRQQARYFQEDLVRARRMLAAPPATPMPDDMI